MNMNNSILGHEFIINNVKKHSIQGDMKSLPEVPTRKVNSFLNTSNQSGIASKENNCPKGFQRNEWSQVPFEVESSLSLLSPSPFIENDTRTTVLSGASSPCMSADELNEAVQGLPSSLVKETGLMDAVHNEFEFNQKPNRIEESPSVRSLKEWPSPLINTPEAWKSHGSCPESINRFTSTLTFNNSRNLFSKTALFNDIPRSRRPSFEFIMQADDWKVVGSPSIRNGSVGGSKSSPSVFKSIDKKSRPRAYSVVEDSFSYTNNFNPRTGASLTDPFTFQNSPIAHQLLEQSPSSFSSRIFATTQENPSVGALGIEWGRASPRNRSLSSTSINLQIGKEPLMNLHEDFPELAIHSDSKINKLRQNSIAKFSDSLSSESNTAVSFANLHPKTSSNGINNTNIGSKSLSASENSQANELLYFVEFKAKRTGIFYSEKRDIKYNVGDKVIVEADRGEDLGTITADMSYEHYKAMSSGNIDASKYNGVNQSVLHSIRAKEIAPKKLYRIATAADISLLQVKYQDEAISLSRCQTKVKQRKLPMEVVDAEYQWDRNKLTFYFLSDRRIDFRELVRELFRVYKTRIWMCAVDKDRQISNAQNSSYLNNDTEHEENFLDA